MSYVTLRRLEVFLAIVETGSFAAASDRLEIAQPSVSAHIRAIERDVGGLVFNRRRGGKPVLTEIGRSVLAHAREMIAEARDLRAEVLNLRAAHGRRVVFSCQRSLANFIFKEQITAFARAHSDIQMVIRIGTQEEVMADVRHGLSDVGCYLGNEEVRGLKSKVIGHHRLVLVAAPGHPLAGKPHVKASEVLRYGFVGPPPSSLFGRTVSRLLAGVGISGIKIVAQATEYQFLRELVAAGVGLACSPEKNVEPDLMAGSLVRLDLDAPGLIVDIRQIPSPLNAESEPAVALMDFLGRTCRDLVAPQSTAKAREAQP